MRRFHIYFSGIFMLGIVASCTTHYHVSDISRSRILVDSRYDNMVDNDVQAFMAPYKHKVDSIMSPKLGRVAKNMSAHKPESEQSNLLADILVWAGDKYNEKPDIGLYNMGGIRADLIKGDVTYGDVLDMAPFENKICFLTLSGEKTAHSLQTDSISRRRGCESRRGTQNHQRQKTRRRENQRQGDRP